MALQVTDTQDLTALKHLLARQPAGLEFYPEPHEYYLDRNLIPNVTLLIEEGGLVDYSHSTLYALERGRIAHLAIHYDLEGDLDVEDPESCPPLAAPYVLGARAALAQLGAATLVSERRVVSRKLRYAGTLDWVGIINGRIALADWFTGFNPPPGKAIQTAAYDRALEEETGIRVQDRYVIGLNDQGECNVVGPLTGWNDFNLFMAALALWNWRKEHVQ
jgi:hypothetical protein